MLSVNEDGTIIETDSCVLQAEDGSKVIVKKHLTDVSADFDGENYVVTCNIANDYIDFDKICIARQFYY